MLAVSGLLPESVLKPMPPFTVVGAKRETSPVGITVPDRGETVIAAATDWPWVIVTCAVAPFSFRLVFVTLKLPTAVPHAVARFATFTVPSPVARS
jgi:hypothetical protein